MVKNVIKAGVLATVAALVVAPAAFAANTTKVVTPNNLQTWLLNRDTSTTSPYEFTNAAASTGSGSLYVKPIDSANPKNKFIAELPLNIPASQLKSVSYDFKIDGKTEDAKQFYLNVYAKAPGSANWYDCRYDYVPTTGSVDGFTTVSFANTATPTNIAAKTGVTCAATVAQMPADWTITQIALNVGDTTTADTGVAGYLDNVVVTTTDTTTVYNFELTAPDATAPVATITSPTEGQTVQGSVTFTGTVTDDTALSHYYASILNKDGKAVANSGVVKVTGTKADVKYTVDTRTLPDGTYTFMLEVRDAAGNKSQTASVQKVTFVVNNIPDNKAQCKKDGWKTLMKSDGKKFKNQGDCVSYVERQKHIQAHEERRKDREDRHDNVLASDPRV